MEPTVNTLDIPVQTQPNDERIEVNENQLTAKMSEEDFAVAVTNNIRDARDYWNKLRLAVRQETNFKYWIGDQVDKSALRDDQEKWVENAIFRNIETFIPIATSRTPELSATPAYKNRQTREYAMDVKRINQTEWEVYQGMQQLVSRGIRNHQMNFIAVFKLGRDAATGKFWTKEIVATDLVISKNGDFVAHYIKDETLGDILEKFPEKKREILIQCGLSPNLEPNSTVLATKFEYIEAWTHEVVGWKIKDLVLDVQDNPHFDYTGVDFTVGTDANGQPIKKLVKYNHFDSPRMPFLFLQYFTRGVHVYDDTSLIEQGIGPQNWINTRKRQIGLNADSTNGHWVSSGDYISKEEFMKITGGIDEKIWLQNGMPADGLSKITGQPLPDYIYTDLIDSRGALDNLMGTHATTRGEKSNNNTLGQDMMAKDADYGRVDGYVRDGIEKLAKDWYEYMYHMRLVYGLSEESIAIPEDDDFESDNVLFSRDMVPLIKKNNGDLIPVPLILRVKQGSTLPEDEMATYAKAKDMKDALNPMDYFKMVGVPNPRELYKNFLIHSTDPFYLLKDDPDIQAMMQKKAEEQAAAAQAAAEQEAAKQNATISAAQVKADGQVEAAKAKAAATNGAAPVDAPAIDPNGEATDKGVANALRAEIEANGMDPRQFLQA